MQTTIRPLSGLNRAWLGHHQTVENDPHTGHQPTTSTPPDSEVYFINVHRRLDTQFDEVFREPVARTFSPLVAKKNEKVPIGVVLACRTECTHEFVVRDAVDQHVWQLFANDTVLRDELCDEADGPHLPHERRIEADLVDAVQNIACSVRHLFTEQRIDMNDDNVGALAVID